MCLTACSHLAVMPPTKWIGQCLVQLQQILLRPLLPTESAASIAADRGSSGSSLRSHNSGSHYSSFVSRRSTQDMANTLWALGSLRIRPNAVWMADFVAASATVLAESQPQEICNTIWALAKLQVVPSQAWLLAFDQATLSCMDQFTAQGLADLLAAQVSLDAGQANHLVQSNAASFETCCISCCSLGASSASSCCVAEKVSCCCHGA